ncbi:Siderophore synthetase large component, acetyltransferase [Minicystis rosea]|nr:Siderophore synthetase large component, acetyltransferase [Minicystis rosea]
MFAALLDGYLREIARGEISNSVLRHDPELAALHEARGRRQWVRIPVDAAGLDIHCPVSHVSATGRHHLEPPAYARRKGEARLEQLGLFDFVRILTEIRPTRPGPGGVGLVERLHDAVDNLTTILTARSGERALGLGSFIEAEQALLLGHPTHPLAKSRYGFVGDDLRRYSPELEGWFKLHYFLAHRTVAVEESAVSPKPSAVLRAALLDHPETPDPVRQLLLAHPDWVVLPAHPWEGDRLLRQAEIQAAIERGLLLSLGPLGDEYTATASVRTVYRPDAPFMLKLSLHVAVTNCERINYLHEMEKGVDVAKLLATAWGRAVERDFPALRILSDPGYLALAWEGDTVAGLRTVVRQNPFPGDEKVFIAASLCEAPVARRSSLEALVRSVSLAKGISLEQAALLWFERYVDVLLGSVIGVYCRHGLALEAHQQNIMVGVDEIGLPDRVYYRDNQGFYFRAGRAEEIRRHVPDFRNGDRCIVAEPDLFGPFAYYLFVNNVYAFVDALVSARLAREVELSRVVKAKLTALLAEDDTGFVRHVLDAPFWPVKSNLQMPLEGIDEATRPNESFAIFVPCCNPLWMVDAYCKELTLPERGILYRRFMPRYDAHFEIRSFDLEEDLETVHAWVNQDYAKSFWQMDGPMQTLEEWYVELMANPYLHGFMGLVDGEPAFVFETYWAPRDVVGRTYEGLPGDYGFHLIVAPPTIKRPNFTFHVFQVVLEFMFRHPLVGRVVGEASAAHDKLNRLLWAVGYRKEKLIQLPDKIANLTFCTREDFLVKCPDSEPFLRGDEARTNPDRAAPRAGSDTRIA